MDGSFEALGPAAPASPVVLSVPHAGRDYPLALRAGLRVPMQALLALEDRYVDAVAGAARHDRHVLLVQRRARAWIDLNRGEDERDPRVDEGAAASAQPFQSTKLRSGLGLVPRRAGVSGDLYRRRFTSADVEARIAADHRPYHAALRRALLAAQARFGVAVLLDIHSMPPLASGAHVVLGDRFGRSAAPRFVARAEAESMLAGRPARLNTPYAGGHILERHGAPANGIHAIQLELDRSLYLDAALDRPGTGLAPTAALVGRIVTALEDEALATPFADAAE